MTCKEFEKLCSKFLTDSLSAEETKLFENLLSSSKSFKEIYEAQERIWKTSSLKNIEPEINSDRDWSLLESKLDLSEPELKSSNTISWISTFWKPAAAVAVVALILLFTFSENNLDPVPTNKTITVSTTNGEVKKLLLPDGSFVQLNNTSTIEYPESFSENSREIMLRGEAFFEVEKGVKPFIVNTQNAKTTVLGTEFNVKARDSITSVIVREGLVNLSSSLNTEKGVNIPGNYVSNVTKKNLAITPQKVDAEKMLGWLDGKLVFVKTPLSEIVKELERFYDKKVALDSDKIESLTISGSFTKNDIDTTLTMICLTLNLSFEQNMNGFIIKQK